MRNEFSRWKLILAIAWPLIIANSFWNLQLTIDRVFLSMHSTEALGAAMAVMGVFWVPMAMLQGTASYITTFVAQYFGAHEQSKIGACVWQALYVSLVGGTGLLAFNFISPWFFGLIGHPPAIQALEVEYYNAVAFSALPTAIVAVVSGFFTGLGRTRTVIGINFIGLVLNVILELRDDLWKIWFSRARGGGRRLCDGHSDIWLSRLWILFDVQLRARIPLPDF
ncbi:MAG: hypothetical protein HC883_03555 [Bdellovibrionaceae bacterium]|nr:hypothetical protein [Pseudobdellovibrionaceae bacterium]